MSTEPQVIPAPLPPEGEERKLKSPHHFSKWHERVLGFCFALFALELGLFLVIFPWLSSWDVSWVPLQSRALRTVWMNAYLRGALSGLGLVNLYIGFGELARQLRSLFR
jgi:hypothetical protein